MFDDDNFFGSSHLLKVSDLGGLPLQENFQKNYSDLNHCHKACGGTEKCFMKGKVSNFLLRR